MHPGSESVWNGVLAGPGGEDSMAPEGSQPSSLGCAAAAYLAGDYTDSAQGTCALHSA